MTKFAVHKALKLTASCKLTLDEKVVPHRVGRSVKGLWSRKGFFYHTTLAWGSREQENEQSLGLEHGTKTEEFVELLPILIGTVPESVRSPLCTVYCVVCDSLHVPMNTPLPGLPLALRRLSISWVYTIGYTEPWSE